MKFLVPRRAASEILHSSFAIFSQFFLLFFLQLIRWLLRTRLILVQWNVLPYHGRPNLAALPSFSVFGAAGCGFGIVGNLSTNSGI